MLDRETVELWVLEHACKFRIPSVFKAAWSRCASRVRHGGLPDVYLAMMDLHTAVSGDLAQLSEDRVVALDRGQQLMEHIFHSDRRLSSHAPLVAKTIISMRIKVLFWYLGRTRSEALAKMNHFFPRRGLPLLEQLCPSKAHFVIEFRRFFLPLLAHNDMRASYMQTDFQQEYGPDFNKHLKNRARRFLSILQSLLPPSPIERIISRNGQALLGAAEGSQERVTMEMVMQCLSDVRANSSSATVQALLDLLTMVSPLHPLERPPVHPHLHLLHSQSSLNSEDATCPESGTQNNTVSQPDGVPPVVPTVPHAVPSVSHAVPPVPPAPAVAAVPHAGPPVSRAVPPAPDVAAVDKAPPRSARGGQQRKDSSSSSEGASGVVTRSKSRQKAEDSAHADRRKHTVTVTVSHKNLSTPREPRVSPRGKTRRKHTSCAITEVPEKGVTRCLGKSSSAGKAGAVAVGDGGATDSGVATAMADVRRSVRLTRRRGAEREKDDASADDNSDRGPSKSSGESTSLISRRLLPRRERWDTQIHIISSSSDSAPTQPGLPEMILVPDSSSDGPCSNRLIGPDSSLELGKAADSGEGQHPSPLPQSSLDEECEETSREDEEMGDDNEDDRSSLQGKGEDSDLDASPLEEVPSPSSSIIPSSCMEEVEEWDLEDSGPQAEEVQLPDFSRFVHP